MPERVSPPSAVDYALNVYEDKQGRTVLSARGELDALTTPHFGASVGEAVRQEKGDVVVDLREATFIDSTGLHVLLNAQRRLTRTGRRLSVICDGSPVRRALELARLTETLGLQSKMP
jgi:anti-sigma B factor antagonist